ncbi:ribonuclease H-like domain-containing protein [Tanacetum coccineum]
MLLQSCPFPNKVNMNVETKNRVILSSSRLCSMGCPVTTEEKAQKKNDVKTRSMLLMARANEHQMTFNQYRDAKTLFDAIQTRFGGNDATSKTQKTLLKQMYENFNAPSTESLDSIFNRNKSYLDIMSIDDLYNNFKIVEQEVKRTVTSSSNSNSSSQNMLFVSSPNSTNEVNTANVQVSTANSPVSNADTPDSTANLNDLEEMDLKWQLALLSMRARRYFQRTSKKITINVSDTAGYDKSKVECFNCHKIRHFARECRGPWNQDNRNMNQDSSRRTVSVEETLSKAMVAIDGYGFDWSFMADEEVPTNMALMDFSDSEVHNDKTFTNTCLKSFETLKTQYDNLRIEFNKSEFNLATYKRGLASVKEQLVFYKKNEVMFCDQIVVLKKDTLFKDSEINALKRSQISDNSRKGVGFISYNVVPPPPTGLFAPSTIDLSNSGLEEFQQPEFKGYGPKASKTVCKDTSNEVKKTPDALLGKKLVSEKEKQNVFPTKIKSVKQQEKPARKSVKYAEMYKSQNPRRNQRNWNNLKSQQLGGQLEQQLMLSGQIRLILLRPQHVRVIHKKKDQGYVDSGCSRHMTGNMSYLSDFKEFDKGYVTFGGGDSGGKITGKGTLKISKLDCKDVYFVKELQFNLFSVSQMCDKKNIVLFTDTACFVLSPNFKLPDESQVLLKVPRKNNMYSVDMKSIVPKESLTCLVAKATLNESMIWHRRLGHINFKNINKLVKDNLVKGLPAKRFENNQTCVACLKGKQHKASCKFDGKSNDGFFVGYSLNSKAFIVYNIRTMKVEENLHVRFFGEDKLLMLLNGTKGAVDIDVLTKSMNYVLVVAGTNSNDFVGTKESNGISHSSKEP